MLDISKTRGVATLVFSGEVTVAQASSLKDDLLGSLEGSREVVLDLRAVERFDLAGLQLLVLLRREALGAGRGFRVSGVSGEAGSVISLSGAGPMLGCG